MKTAVIVKTHNNGHDLPLCIDALLAQTTLPEQIIIVDTGSEETSYLDPYRNHPLISLLIKKEDLGFCVGNNLGYELVDPNAELVLFLNPDAFLTPSVIEEAYRVFTAEKKVGALTGTLLQYDLKERRALSRCDSRGIFRSWWGRWYDRDQGKQWKLEDAKQERVPAICGAFFFCRKSALDESLLKGREVFDSSFFMYKEDIELSLRLRRKGWDLLYVPEMIIYHCRGWGGERSRSSVSRFLRLLAARNELRLHCRYRSPYSIVSFLKWSYVKTFNG